jgi:hypothetical protein
MSSNESATDAAKASEVAIDRRMVWSLRWRKTASTTVLRATSEVAPDHAARILASR